MHSLMHSHYANAVSKMRYDRRVNRPSWKRNPAHPRPLRLPRRSP